MTKSARSGARKTVTIVLAFFLSLFLFFSSILFIVQYTVLNTNYLRGQLTQSHYYENVTTEVENEFASYASASGFDEAFFKTVLDMNDVQLKVNQSLSTLYGEGGGTIGAADFEDKLNQKLLENVRGRGITVSANTEKNLQLLAKTCSTTYVQYVSFPYAEQISSYLLKMKTPCALLEAVFLFLSVCFATAIFLMNRWRHRAIRACIYALSGTVLMLFALPVWALASGIVERISFISKSLYLLAVSYCNGVLFLLFTVALALAVILVLLVLLYRHFLKKAEEGSQA